MYGGHFLHSLLVTKDDWIILQTQAVDSQVFIRKLSHYQAARAGSLGRVGDKLARHPGHLTTSSSAQKQVLSFQNNCRERIILLMAIREQNRAVHVWSDGRVAQ